MSFKGRCVVSNAGITSDGRAAILLKSPDFPQGQGFAQGQGRNFKSKAGLTSQMLAVALAAITSNKEVYCDIPDEATEWSDIIQINLMSGQ